jgi:hypothetical protein
LPPPAALHCFPEEVGLYLKREKEFLMNATTHEPLSLNDEERVLLGELLDEARTKLLVEIRRTDHRAYRDALRERLTLLENLRERCGHAAPVLDRDA